MDTYLVASHLPGLLNERADFLSRGGGQNHKWTLTQTYLDPVFRAWGTLEIDVFATRHNSKCRWFLCKRGIKP